jgi:hypothetical protein
MTRQIMAVMVINQESRNQFSAGDWGVVGLDSGRHVELSHPPTPEPTHPPIPLPILTPQWSD